MNINQHNYEEFFLLYVDNELSAADRQAVEQFAAENPDLAIELEMLMQLQLPADPVNFVNKDGLFRKESKGISLANYEEHFLLYVDNELDKDSKTEVETFVLKHPSLQESFTQLKQTRLEPETVVFADKQSLYRKEKERRVVYLTWQRLAIAAAFIGVVALLWNVLPGDTVEPKTVAVTRSAGTDPSKNENASATNTIAAKPGDDRTSQPDEQSARNIASTRLIASNNNTPGTPVVTTPVVPVIEGADIQNRPVQRQDIIASVSHNDFARTTATTGLVSGDNATIENADIVRNARNEDDVDRFTVQPAVYKELDTEDEKKSLLLGSLEINKDKLRGFFRKAGSLFRSKSKNEEERTDSRSSSDTRPNK